MMDPSTDADGSVYSLWSDCTAMGHGNDTEKQQVYS